MKIIFNAKHFYNENKKYFVLLMVCAWVIIFVYALKKNPGVSEAQSKFAMMKDDMSKLMSVGGKVVSSHQRSKYGSALIYKTLSDEG